jgi:hypothetical protein
VALTKEFFERLTNITARVVCDSITAAGARITTIEAEYPRFILGEVNTHSSIEKNSSSSRAIPIKEIIAQIIMNGGKPLYWGSKKSGMQAGEEIENLACATDLWNAAQNDAIFYATQLDLACNLHKQSTNRLLEPFQMMKTVMTATDWDNFFNLRIHPDAQPEFCMLAYKIYMAMKDSEPTLLRDGEWHLPYVDSSYGIDEFGNAIEGTLRYHTGEVGTDTFQWHSLEEAQRISASCCAQTSYRKSDDSLEKADKIFDMLIGADVLHASPFGHLATPVKKEGLEKRLESGGVYVYAINNAASPNTWQEGITHLRRDGRFGSGNLTGWVSYRHLLPYNTCWKFNLEERLKMFK